jgi:hypothetical protein
LAFFLGFVDLDAAFVVVDLDLFVAVAVAAFVDGAMAVVVPWSVAEFVWDSWSLRRASSIISSLVLQPHAFMICWILPPSTIEEESLVGGVAAVVETVANDGRVEVLVEAGATLEIEFVRGIWLKGIGLVYGLSTGIGRRRRLLLALEGSFSLSLW